MTVLNESNNQLLSELELDARKPRKVQVRRRAQQSVEDSLAAARVAEAVAAAVKSCGDVHAQTIAMMECEHEAALETIRATAHQEGVREGRREEAAESEDTFEDDVNSRVCDRDRKLPWSVGVIVAGEQHRILQALADWLDEFDGRLNYGSGAQAASSFTKEALDMPWYPERTQAPDPVNRHNCEEPPVTNSDPTLPQDNFTAHWIYYADQLEAD